jgi:hypothetical protein
METQLVIEIVTDNQPVIDNQRVIVTDNQPITNNIIDTDTSSSTCH